MCAAWNTESVSHSTWNKVKRYALTSSYFRNPNRKQEMVFPIRITQLNYSILLALIFNFSSLLLNNDRVVTIHIYWARGGKSCNTFPELLWMEEKARNGLTIWYELITNIMDSSFITAGRSWPYNCMAKSIHSNAWFGTCYFGQRSHTLVVVHWSWNWNHSHTITICSQMEPKKKKCTKKIAIKRPKIWHIKIHSLINRNYKFMANTSWIGHTPDKATQIILINAVITSQNDKHI